MTSQFIIIIFLGLMVFWWSTQGLFSSFLNLLAVIASGALAFGLWEWITYQYFIGSMREYAWGIGLLGTFGVSLLASRIIIDLLVPGNVQFQEYVDKIGGGIAGLFSGIIVAGILVIGIQFLGPLSMPGYIAYSVNDSGRVEKTGSLWIPVDTMTSNFYLGLSKGAFAPITGPSLADYYPDIAEAAATFHWGSDPEANRVLVPGSAKVPDGAYHLLNTPPASLATILGAADTTAVVRTEIAMRHDEQENINGADKFYIAATQVALIYKYQDELMTAYPVGYIESETYHTNMLGNDKRGTAVELYDASRRRNEETKVPEPRPWSGPGRLAFVDTEVQPSKRQIDWVFQIPKNAEPQFLNLKSSRLPLPVPANDPGKVDMSIAWIDDKPISQPNQPEAEGTENSESSGPSEVTPSGSAMGAAARLARFSDELPFAVSARHVRSMIVGGNRLGVGTATAPRPADVPDDAIQRLDSTAGHEILQLTIDHQRGESLWGRAMRTATVAANPPTLVTEDNQEIYAFGFSYEGPNQLDITILDDNNEIRSLGQIGIRDMQADQTLRLYFKVPSGTTLSGFRLGSSREQFLDGLTAP